MGAYLQCGVLGSCRMKHGVTARGQQRQPCCAITLHLFVQGFWMLRCLFMSHPHVIDCCVWLLVTTKLLDGIASDAHVSCTPINHVGQSASALPKCRRQLWGRWCLARHVGCYGCASAFPRILLFAAGLATRPGSGFLAASACGSTMLP